jgi:hypothetical protein
MDPIISLVIVLSILLWFSLGGNIWLFTKSSGTSPASNFLSSFFPASSTGPAGGPNLVYEFMSLLIAFSPNVFFTFGFLLDIFNSSYHYSVPSLTALAAMILNRFAGGIVADLGELAGQYSGKVYDASLGKLLGKELPIKLPSSIISSKPTDKSDTSGIELKPFRSVFDTSTPSTDTSDSQAVLDRIERQRQAALEKDRRDAERTSRRRQRGGANSPISIVETCSLPGFGWLENDIAPQGIVMSMTILSYLLYELWDHGMFNQSIGLLVTTGIVFVLQSINLISSGCLSDYRYKNWSILIALLVAVGAGTTSYTVQKMIWGADVMPAPFAQSQGGLRTNVSQSDGTTKIFVGGSSEHSLPVQDQDQFVCEAYKDGELVTSTIVG